MVYARDSKSRSERIVGSSPTSPTTHQLITAPLAIRAIKWRKLSGALYCHCSTPQIKIYWDPDKASLIIIYLRVVFKAGWDCGGLVV